MPNSWSCDLRITVRPPAPDERFWHGHVEVGGAAFAVTSPTSARLNDDIAVVVRDYLRNNAGKKP